MVFRTEAHYFFDAEICKKKISIFIHDRFFFLVQIKYLYFLIFFLMSKILLKYLGIYILLTALLAHPIRVHGGLYVDRFDILWPDGVALWRISDLFLRHDSIDFGEYVLESQIDVGRVQGGRFDETEAVLFGERLRLLGEDGAQVSQVRFVTHLGRLENNR